MKKSMFALLLLAFTAVFLIQLPARVFAGPAEDVQAAMQLLKSKATTLGAPIVNGDEAVAGKIVPAIHFGTTKMNNNFVLVDEVQKEAGGTATIFVKSGDEFVRVATNVKKDDGSRAIVELNLSGWREPGIWLNRAIPDTSQSPFRDLYQEPLMAP